jgi:hypothetical protein
VRAVLPKIIGDHDGSPDQEFEDTMDRSDALVVCDDEAAPDGNVPHMAEHGLTIAEVESVLLNPRNPRP